MKGSARFRLGWTLTSLLIVVSLLLPWAVFADQVVNNIDTTIDPAYETRTITAGGSTVVGFYVQPSNTIPAGDASGCNATGANPAIVNLSIPAGVSALPTSLTFTGCGIVQNVTFSSSTAGSYTIGVAGVTGGKSGSLWDTAPAVFTLIVNPPADSTPPVITPSVSGVLGNDGWYVSAVTVSWNVTDPESLITSKNGCDPTTINTDTAGDTLTCWATSAGGTSSQSVTIKRDATPPTISGAASPAPNAAGWYNSDVTVHFTCYDALSGIPTGACPADQILGAEGAAVSSTAQTVTDAAGNTSGLSNVATVKIDKTAPAASASASPGPNANGWNNSSVTVSFSGSDSLSGIDYCDAAVVLSSEGAGQSASGTCIDNAGNVSAPATASGINIDKTAPIFGACPTGGPFRLNSGLQSVGPIGIDAAISGLNTGLSTLSGSVDTSSIGSKSVTFTAIDNAGNGATKACSYSVIYNWNGFFRPVDNLPTLNVAKAGSAIPVKFSLSGNQGLSIFAAGYPKWQVIACDTGAQTDTIEETVTAGNSSLSYDPVVDQYVYVWKTDKAWSGCRQLVVKLDDGMEYRASFKFTK